MVIFNSQGENSTWSYRISSYSCRSNYIFFFEFIKAWKFHIVFPYVMKTWIVSSLDEETIQGEEIIPGRKLYEEIQ